MNCLAIEHVDAGRGIALTDLQFSKPLKRGDPAFYAYKTVINSDEEMEPLFYHNVTSSGVKKLVCRIQFDTSELPAKIWHFSRREETELHVPPAAGSDDYLEVNEIGFAEHTFTNCRPGFKVGISWKWQAR